MSPSRRQRRRVYEYEPLPLRCFRLLELTAGETLYSDVTCRLLPCSFAAAPPYEALSYTWGDNESKRRITVNGLAFFVRQNLLSILRRLRQPRQKRIIWVDAICINQNSTAEKSVQVPLMREIYSQSKRTIVWLGEERFYTETAIKFIPELTVIVKADIRVVWKYLLSQDTFLRQMSSLIWFFHHPWWTRTWVIQEVALAKNVHILCGPHQLCWSTIHSLIIAWMDSKNVPDLETCNSRQAAALRSLGMLIANHTEALARLREEFQSNPSAPECMELANLLWSFKYHSATDARDKIYGFLGLLKGHGLRVDYSKAPQDIYISVFQSFLVRDRGLDWFRWMTGEQISRDKKTSEILNLPSWVPDFGSRTTYPISSFIPNAERGERQRIFSVAGSDRSRSLVTLQFEDNDRTLVVRGLIFDVVDQRGHIFPLPDPISLSGCPTEPILTQWKNMAFATPSEPYNTRLEKEDAFWRTILTDRELEGLHFKDNAGWVPAKRLSSTAIYIPPKTADEEQKVLRAMRRGLCVYGRRFCISENGYFCLLPATSRKGDLISVLLGGEVPYVLRRQAMNIFRMVGECYVHGIMNGELVTGDFESHRIFKLQ
ncbi:heterokaryon incompatibility protein-domain-containing protein [Ilyonectria sp. MPI-CAGE-AT-0026]|nr:heterokaryon incompatibility protein-domain-containing protein [Ilyonectria sp. MPI-CAGE-AT-0026]